MRPTPMAEPMPSATPILSVRDLETLLSSQDEGVGARRRRRRASTSTPGRTLGIVGESGCGKSVTARSILRIVDRPGRIVGGEIWLRRGRRRAAGRPRAARPDGPRDARDPRRRDRADLPGADDLASALHTIGNQIIEAIRAAHRASRQGGRARARDRAAAHGRHPAAGAAHRRLSVPALAAACASAR